VTAAPAATHEEMRSYLLGFPRDLAESTGRAREWAAAVRSGRRPRALALAGLGGSATGGDLARALLRDRAAVPFEVVRDYRLPAWVDGDAAVLASSYSGNTEETLAAFDEARARGASLIVVTSGGELAARAEAAGCPLFRLPGGLPPRAAIGHSLPPVLLAAAVLAGLDAEEHARDLAGAAARLEERGRGWDEPRPGNPARELAARLARTIPVFYAGTGFYEPAAVRWRAQLAENAKMLSFHHLLPEMDHNEIVGWQENPSILRQCRAVFLTGGREHPRVARRVDITADILRPVAGGVEIVRSPGGAPAEDLLGLVLLGDWVSLHAAAEHGVAPVPVDRIAVLKGALAGNPR
jgi:glucose/mannose-6-phosphate isomerase